MASPQPDYPYLRLVLIHFTSVPPRWHNFRVAHMSIDESAVLRLRICGHSACRATFTRRR
jgi:hypothetical protein